MISPSLRFPCRSEDHKVLPGGWHKVYLETVNIFLCLTRELQGKEFNRKKKTEPTREKDKKIDETEKIVEWME